MLWGLGGPKEGFPEKGARKRVPNKCLEEGFPEKGSRKGKRFPRKRFLDTQQVPGRRGSRKGFPERVSAKRFTEHMINTNAI